jgi:hypothetical protein
MAARHGVAIPHGFLQLFDRQAAEAMSDRAAAISDDRTEAMPNNLTRVVSLDHHRDDNQAPAFA